jgi:hypothetical protein
MHLRATEVRLDYPFLSQWTSVIKLAAWEAGFIGPRHIGWSMIFLLRIKLWAIICQQHIIS